ncbi:3-oxoacyl-[acyl-carrier protein] reductase [Geomicrobium halophilum]|uniref:3-oxoacyl-[acyl-carrier protein] reductase n=1 Tax=Geomicrobium halophilum TaxID=549000 RepID=A0A841PN12_9BACL|nr:SDR family oxidoreductase [Geomicrobium halophilum]MBB6450150.1 3-oxoacyl-[acyl-carrier protein] reductase [Geomicrobium halophilum]
MRFKDQIALITGAGSGIGKETAARLTAEGAKVILVGRTEEKLQRVAAEVPGSVIYPADVTVKEDTEKLAAFVEREFETLDILINGAGGSRHSSVMDTTEEDWDAMQDVNLKSVFLASKALGAVMVQQVEKEFEKKPRAIVNVTSLSGHQAGAHIPHYSSAKAGAINFTKALALELAPYGIRVNSVSPGFVETPLTEGALTNEKFSKAIERNTALKRVGQAEEIANVVAFVASSEASYMVGSDVLVDGGWLIK